MVHWESLDERNMKPMRVYIDTSVFGGYFDEEFSEITVQFFDALFAGKITALISDTLVEELIEAPRQVQDLLERTLQTPCERFGVSEQTNRLKDAYLRAGIVTGKYADDALHVAHATIVRADVVVSWNFKHLVNPQRERAFNGVNLACGYGLISILTPMEIGRIAGDDDE
jgi:predicted nucleic acid-binding protein